MKTLSPIFVVLCALFLLHPSAARAGTVINPPGTISQINGPADSNLDLAGKMAYAINFSANDPPMFVNGVTFTPDRLLPPGLTVGVNSVEPWGAMPGFGAGIDADNLEQIYQDIRYALPANGQALEAHLPVTNGETYKLQLLIYGNGAENRRWDIEVEGTVVVDEFTSLGASDAGGVLPAYSAAAGVVYTRIVTAADATLDVRMGDFGGLQDFGDRNPIWQGLTLEHIVPDTDGDGLPDAWENANFGNLISQAGTGDADADGLPNQHEYQLGTNPALPAGADTDSDSLNDGLEYFTHRTNPLAADTDGDGLNDGGEITAGSNPLVTDTDFDGLTDGAEVNIHGSSPILADTDGDDYPDGVEVANSTNPNNALLFPTLASFGRVITGADAGEGLDLTGTFKYAFNVGTTSVPGLIRGVNFTAETAPGITIAASANIPNWGSYPAFGNTADDDALEILLASIRHAGSNGGSITITLTGLTPGKPHKLQLIFLERCCARAADIYVDGVLKLDEFAPYTYQDGTGAPTRAAGAVIGFFSSGTTAQIVLSGATVTTPAYTDRNPILNGLTLEELTGTDSDGDGLDDLWETAHFNNLGQVAAGDPDADGLSNLQEFGAVTDPRDADTDNDGLNDGPEVLTYNTNPRNADTDGDTLTDQFEVVTSLTNPLLADTDGDTYGDNVEFSQGTSPTNAAQYPLISSLVNSFTGGDAGEGLDLSGVFPFSFNVGTPGAAPGPVGNAAFTADSTAGVVISAANEIGNWHAPNYGSTANDDNLEFVMQSIRWSPAPAPLTVDVAGLTAGKAYKLQLLFAEQCCAGRAFDIEVEGVLRVDEFNPSIAHGGAGNNTRGAVVTVGFVAGDDTLNIVLNGQSVYTPAFIDHNPILGAVTVEELVLADTDGDTLADAWEMQFFGNLAQSASGDGDSDGRTNAAEYLANTVPTDSDTDNDGLTDGAETGRGTNPLLSDTDGDDLPDGAEVTRGTDPLLADTDGDTYPDCAEIAGGSNPLVAASTPAQATIGVFTGGDAGEGLDLDGTFLYAFNFGTPGAIAGQARDTVFSADNAPDIGYSALNQIPNWHAPSYGDTAADNVLEGVMQSIRWAGAPDTVRLQLARLEVGKRYKLQLLFAETGTARGFDVMVEGGVVADDFFPGVIMGNTNAQGCVVSYEFTAHDTVLRIELNGNGAPAAPDKNPILGGVTLELLPPPADLGITSVSLTSSGITINAIGTPGATYSVDYSTDLRVWEEVMDSLVPDGDGLASWRDTHSGRVGPAIRRGFYRLRDPLLDPTP